MIPEDQIATIVQKAVLDHLEGPVALTASTPVYSPGSEIDSLALVGILCDIEGEISNRFRVDIVIASDRALSQKRSPFQTVGTLTQFVSSLCRNGCDA